MPSLRTEIRDRLQSSDLAGAAALVIADRRAFGGLVRLSYAKDTLLGWRAILVVGIAARELVKADRTFLRETCRKLLWSLSDESGGIGWSAPELLGEIVSADPRQFTDLIPLIANVLDIEEKVFRPGVVYALGRIAETAPGLVAERQSVVISALNDRDPLVRHRGLELVGLLWKDALGSDKWSLGFQQQVRQTVEHLTEDRDEVWVYRGDGFISEIVGDQAKATMNIIQ